jgi:hypothetical protein
LAPRFLCLAQLIAFCAVKRISGFLRLLLDTSRFREFLRSFAILAIGRPIALSLIGPFALVILIVLVADVRRQLALNMTRGLDMITFASVR